MSKYRLDNSPIYIDGSDVPKNKLGITDSKLIHEIENNLLLEAYEVFSQDISVNTDFNEDYFKSLHKKTFESLYDFAGLYRGVNMSKGDSQFCLARYLESESKRIFIELEKEKFLQLHTDRVVFAKRVAYYQGELIALHPFYEINGRILRLFFDLICLANGYRPIDYSNFIDNGQYIEASIECVQFADTKKMEKIIIEGLSR